MSLPSTQEIASIIGNEPLASAIDSAVTAALECPFVHLIPGRTVWEVFKRSLDAAIRDIENDARGRGELFRRLIQYGPHYPTGPRAVRGGKTTVSDSACALCCEFIYSHMINRFKGELAELLALDPCVSLLRRLHQDEPLRSGVHLYWGEMVQEHRQTSRTAEESDVEWSGLSKGADGLLVEEVPSWLDKVHPLCRIHGVVEVKSMVLSSNKVRGQINQHIERLYGGVKLGEKLWLPADMDLSLVNRPGEDNAGLIRVMVLPSTWKLSREWRWQKREEGHETLVMPEATAPPMATRIEQLESNLWKITLAWSQEALNQAAYEMTFWYMAQVGAQVYTKETMPRGWENMDPDEAGYNAIKMMLYYLLLRRLRRRQKRLATRLYNVYCFGYPLGVGSKKMLWPQDFRDQGGTGEQPRSTGGKRIPPRTRDGAQRGARH